MLSRSSSHSASPAVRWLIIAMIAVCCYSVAHAGVQESSSASQSVPAAQSTRADKEFAAAMGEDEPRERGEGDWLDGQAWLYLASPKVGGVFLYPIYAFAFVVLVFGAERMFTLRRRGVIPRKIEAAAARWTSNPDSFDPRAAMRTCQSDASAAAQVLASTLLSLGRPLPEITDASTRAIDRQAARLSANIRALRLAAVVAPLLGLAGAAHGAIKLFFAAAHADQRNAQAMAEGICQALVPLFIGLCIAIVAVCLAYVHESRILKRLADLDALVSPLLPMLSARRDARLPSADVVVLPDFALESPPAGDLSQSLRSSELPLVDHDTAAAFDPAAPLTSAKPHSKKLA